MEYIIISDTKIKITLTQKELDKYNIDSEDFSIGNEEQRIAFRKVLNDACMQSGFDSSSSRLMVQMYPAKRGGCEIFVTRLDSSSSDLHNCIFSNVCNDSREASKKGICFSFQSFERLNAVCRHLRNIGYNGDSDVYAADNGVYYLILNEGRLPENSFTHLSFINEYAKRSMNDIPGYIFEHGRLICEKNAISLIGRL
jgi:adapter protein MecA 1/2